MTTHQIAQLFLALAVIIVLARGFGALARRLGQPPVIGELTAGILVGPTLLPPEFTAMIFPGSIATALAALANVALVLFMFCVGLELDPALMRGYGRVAVSVSIASIAVPFALSVPLAYWLAANHEVSHDASFVLFLGAAMSVTAFPVLARILTDRGMHRIGLGGLALACAAFDDVMAWSLLALVVAIGGFAGGGEWQVLLAVPYVLVMVLAVRPLLRRWLTRDGSARKLTSGVLAGVLFGLLLSCFATEWMGIHYIFGAFLFGAVMPSEGFAELRAAVVERIEPVNMMFLLPVFFILSGMRVNLSTLDMRNILELGLILVVAVVGKFVGAFTSARWLGFDNRKSSALATLMNTRGLTEIVFLTVGLQYAIIDHELFSLMVVMALVTTAMSGPLLTWIYPRRMVARDRVEQRRSAKEFARAA